MRSLQAVFTIIVRNHAVLFVRHESVSGNPTGTYGLPGGKIEGSEAPADAAAREVLEETGLRIHPSWLTEVGTYSPSIETKQGMQRWNVALYISRRFEGELRRGVTAEEPIWLKIRDVLAGKYDMPKMSQSYLDAILAVLREEMDRLKNSAIKG